MGSSSADLATVWLVLLQVGHGSEKVMILCFCMFQALQAPLLTRDFGQISGLKELFTGCHLVSPWRVIHRVFLSSSSIFAKASEVWFTMSPGDP